MVGLGRRSPDVAPPAVRRVGPVAMAVGIGDSHMAQTDPEVSYMKLTALGFPNSRIVNNGEPSDRLALVLAATPPELYVRTTNHFDPTIPVYVVMQHNGANDIEVGRTEQQVLDDILETNTLIKAARPNALIDGCTFFANGALTAGENDIRLAVNAAIRADPGAFLIDLLTDRAEIVPNLPTDLSKFDPDNKHLNNSGEADIFNGANGVIGIRGNFLSVGFR